MDPSAADKSPSSPYDYKWEIPVTYVTSGAPNSKKQKWLTSKDPFVLVNAQSGTDWIKFNVGQYGFYRVNYPEKEWENFAQLLMDNHEVHNHYKDLVRTLKPWVLEYFWCNLTT